MISSTPLDLASRSSACSSFRQSSGAKGALVSSERFSVAGLTRYFSASLISRAGARALIFSALVFPPPIFCATRSRAAESHPSEHFFSGSQLELARALCDGDAPRVAALAAEVELNQPGNEDMTLLFYALQCAFGEKPTQLGALAALVRAGADPFRESPNVGSPLGVALRSKSPDYVRAFLDGGVDPSAKNRHGTPILHQAANHHTADTFRLLIERGADANARDSLASTTLDTAFSEQQYDIVDALLDLGADPNTFDVLGVSFAYSIQFALSRETPGTPAHRKMEQIRDRIIAMGVKWPPVEPPETRDWMRSQGMKVVVPAGHQR